MTRVAVRIHLIEKDRNPPQPVPDAPGLFDSGHWSNCLKTAQQLIGGTIFMHRTQAAPAHDGGLITGVRQTEDGLIVYRYIRSTAAVGREAGTRGWSQEMKIKWEEVETA